MSLNIHNMLIPTQSEIHPNLLLDVNNANTKVYAPTKKLHFSSSKSMFRQIRVRSILLLPYYSMDLDSRQTHNAESDHTWICHSDHFCCWITQQKHRNVLQSCQTCMLHASLRSINVCICRCPDCMHSCGGLSYFLHKCCATPINVHILVSPGAEASNFVLDH